MKFSLPHRLFGRIPHIRTALLKFFGSSDWRRWSSAESLDASWDERTCLLAGMIPANSAVLEFGAGRMILRACLPDGSKYTPADLVSRAEDMVAIDLNAKEWPQFSSYDYVVTSGVLEYVLDLSYFLEKVSGIADNVLCSYATTDFSDQKGLKIRRSHGWVNDFSSTDLEQLFLSFNYRCKVKRLWQHQHLYHFTKSDIGSF